MLTCRLRRVAQRAGLLQKLSFRDLLEDLGTARCRVDGPVPVKSDDSHWVADCKGAFTLMETFGLSIVKSKKSNQVTAKGVATSRKAGRLRILPIFVGPRRLRGQPRESQ